MTLRFVGKLRQWNADRGMGSVAPDQGGDRLHVQMDGVGDGLLLSISFAQAGLVIEAGPPAPPPSQKNSF